MHFIFSTSSNLIHHFSLLNISRKVAYMWSYVIWECDSNKIVNNTDLKFIFRLFNLDAGSMSGIALPSVKIFFWQNYQPSFISDIIIINIILFINITCINISNHFTLSNIINRLTFSKIINHLIFFIIYGMQYCQNWRVSKKADHILEMAD